MDRPQAIVKFPSPSTISSELITFDQRDRLKGALTSTGYVDFRIGSNQRMMLKELYKYRSS